MLAVAGGTRQADPLGTLRELSVGMLEQLAADPRTQAVFELMFNKCEFAAETATVDKRGFRRTTRACATSSAC
jgi:hypothetical protein